ncbi:GntR family transcriptional regulator [Hasllibacter sp. MH4015]|uniref:GntR family transcriptional regulator n=1 Tax=Hasllibacter sp. MH4015 TaxID=2854029 RepID=UPI001CD55EF1|nr:GntR family transcriptional regulator [Hasllibacter sp. MH4015]
MTKSPAPASAYEQIRARILNGEIRPGDRLREVELADDLGLSRTPVREAIRRLEQDGIVEHAAHKGAVVRSLDQSSITELYTIREVLEGTAARLAAQHANSAEIDALEEVLATQPPESADLDAAEASRRNAIFHGAIGQAAHNRFLLSAMDGISSALTLLGPTTLSMQGRIDAARDEHRAILAAIAARDANRAEEAARAHIRAAHRARLRLIYEVA